MIVEINIVTKNCEGIRLYCINILELGDTFPSFGLEGCNAAKFVALGCYLQSLA